VWRHHEQRCIDSPEPSGFRISVEELNDGSAASCCVPQRSGMLIDCPAYGATLMLLTLFVGVEHRPALHLAADAA
jgi:hypothetical protein